MGNVTSMDRDANGLATITIDPWNHTAQDAFDGSGNVIKIHLSGRIAVTGSGCRSPRRWRAGCR
jgi:hypothetical protein